MSRKNVFEITNVIKKNEEQFFASIFRHPHKKRKRKRQRNVRFNLVDQVLFAIAIVTFCTTSAKLHCQNTVIKGTSTIIVL